MEQIVSKPAPVGRLPFNFSIALEQLKKRGKVAREGWNGKGMHVKLVGAIPTGSVVLGRSNRPQQEIIEPFFVIVNKEGVVNTWVPSVSDLLANDWVDVD